MSHNTIEMCKSYYENPNKYKRFQINNWKSRGVIYPDFEDLYDVYMNTMGCQHCNKPFKKSTDRCLDHCHETGLFRMIVCCGCNNMDSYLKYSPEITSKEKTKITATKYREEHREQLKIYNEQHKERFNASRRTRLKCFFCSKELSKSSLLRHYKLGCCIIKPN